jgi:hypothetical protein
MARARGEIAFHRLHHLVKKLLLQPQSAQGNATRYDKTHESFTAMIHLAGSALARRRTSTTLEVK